MKPDFKQLQIISLTDIPNGAEQVLLKMALAVKGNLFFVKRNSGYGLVVPRHILTSYLSSCSIFFGLLRLLPLLGKFEKDEIVMSTHPYLNAFLGFFKRIGYLKSQLIARECTAVFTRFSGIKKIIYELIYKLGYPAIDLVVCQTEEMKAQLIRHNRFIDQLSVLVQPNPVDLDRLNLLAKERLKNEDKNIEFICAAGRLINEKGFDVLIKAFKIVHQQNPDLQLFILGEGKEKSALVALAKSTGLANFIVFKGYVVNPVPYFKYAKLCVVSSLKEGFPNVLLEMMSQNQAVVCTVCAGGISAIPHISKVEVNNIKALARAMQSTLQKADQTDHNPCLTYLARRSPEIFAQSILNALVHQKNGKQGRS